MSMSTPIATDLSTCEVRPISPRYPLFADGSRLTLTAERLRLSCKCAHCTRARIDERFPEVSRGSPSWTSPTSATDLILLLGWA